MKTRILGQGLEVSAIGLGCMTIGKDYSEESQKEAIAIIRKAFQLGVTMFDTAECYGTNSQNEILVGKALKPFREQVVIATKCGVKFSDGHMIIDSSPATIRKSIEGSLKRLQTDYIDLYYIHRVDPNTPIEDVAQTMKELYQEGKIRHWGISEPSMETLRKAHAIFPVTAIESEYNMMFREPEEDILSVLEELEIGLIPYRPLARGFLTDANEGMFLEGAQNTRFDKDNLKANMALKEFVINLAKQKNISAAQLSLAWLLAQKPFIVPIPGTSKLERMEENIQAANITFTDKELKTINDLLQQITIVGERYDPHSENGKSVRK